MPATRLFPALLGESFAGLPDPVRRLHLAPGGTRFAGHADIARGRHPLARLMGYATRLPPPGRVDVDVRIELGDGPAAGAEPPLERWHRQFGPHAMPSRLWAHGGRLRERLGPVVFDFALTADGTGIHWRVAGVRALGLPLPARWFEGVTAVESARGDRYAFEVRATLPVIGPLVHYRGELDAR